MAKKLKAGLYSLRLRFMGESLGERFFDTEFFGRWEPKDQQLVIDRIVTHRGYLDGLPAPTAATLAKLTGHSLSIEFFKSNRRGKKYAGGLMAKISIAKLQREEDDTVVQWTLE